MKLLDFWLSSASGPDDNVYVFTLPPPYVDDLHNLNIYRYCYDLTHLRHALLSHKPNALETAVVVIAHPHAHPTPLLHPCGR